MGFRSGAYCTVWEVERVSDKLTRGRISISHKDRDSGAYVTDFSGFVTFCGTATAASALGLREKDRIKLGDVDVFSKYVKEKKTTYWNFFIYTFEKIQGNGSFGGAHSNQVDAPDKDPNEDMDGGDLPY